MKGALVKLTTQLKTRVRPSELRIATPDSVKSEPAQGPRSHPTSFAPRPPLFDDTQLQQFNEMYAKAPSIYPGAGRDEDKGPNFLQEDEMRLQRLKQEEERMRENRRLALARHEEQAAIWRLYQEVLKKRIELLMEEVATYERMFDEAQFGTPDGSRTKTLGAQEEGNGHTDQERFDVCSLQTGFGSASQSADGQRSGGPSEGVHACD